MSDFMSPGRRIRHYRMLRGMTQKALGITVEAFSRYFFDDGSKDTVVDVGIGEICSWLLPF